MILLSPWLLSLEIDSVTISFSRRREASRIDFRRVHESSLLAINLEKSNHSKIFVIKTVAVEGHAATKLVRWPLNIDINSAGRRRSVNK
mmetsp:Transcript_140/g.269  ORF Transcript_140/g.269 Transcript_140/m.269 type:complete len:89 (-) Transcript_140:1781-2047(-)